MLENLVNISFKTESPLMQTKVDLNKTKGGGTTEIKKMPVLVGSEVKEVPFYSSNGIDGKFRRIGTSIILDAAIRKGITIDKEFVKSYHYMANGGGSGTEKESSLGIAERETLKGLNPLISLFGTGLIVSGKIIIHNFLPSKRIINDESMYYSGEIKDKPGFFWNKSKLIGTDTIIKRDDILDYNNYARKFFTVEDVNEWQKEVEENRSKRKADKDAGKSKNESEKKSDIQNIISREYIIPGVEFYSSVAMKEEWSDIEKGLFYSILREFVKYPLGAIVNKGWGVVSFNIKNAEGDTIMRSYPKDEEYLSEIQIDDTFTDKENACVSAFDNWLKNITVDNIDIAGFIKKYAKAEKEEKE